MDRLAVTYSSVQNLPQLLLGYNETFALKVPDLPLIYNSNNQN